MKDSPDRRTLCRRQSCSFMACNERGNEQIGDKIQKKEPKEDMYHFSEVSGFNMVRREDRRRRKNSSLICSSVEVDGSGSQRFDEATEMQMEGRGGSGAQTETGLATNVGSRCKKVKVLMGNVPPCVGSCRILAVIAWIRFTLQPALANLTGRHREDLV